MRVIEVFGAPGVGKSTLFNDRWPPSVLWDGEVPPASWSPFLAVAGRLAAGCTRESHWRVMFGKAVRKMGTLYRSPDAGVYAGVGLVMRGIDLAWRKPLQDVSEYFEVMPWPAAAISLYADSQTLKARNKARGVAQPGRELSAVAPLFERPRQIAVAILRDRGVPVLELDTRESVYANLSRVDDFIRGLDSAARAACA